MTPYYFIYALVLSGVPISFIDDFKTRRLSQLSYFSFIFLTLTIFVGLRSPYVDRDYLNYLDWFNSIAAGSATTGELLRDPAFSLISRIVSSAWLTYAGVAIAYAALSLLALFYFMVAAALNRWLTLYFYLVFCDYFIVGEMTEIRAMVAIPLMAISLYLACRGEKRRSVLVYLVAVAFHFSVIVALPILILLLLDVKFESRFWIISFAPLTLFAIIGFRQITEFILGMYRISEAANGGAADNDLSRVSWTALARLLVIGASVLFAWKRLSLHHRVAVLCSSLGLSLLLIFISNSGIGFRFMYLFDLYWLLLLVVFLELFCGYKRLIYIALLIVCGFAIFHKSLQDVMPYMWQSATP